MGLIFTHGLPLTVLALIVAPDRTIALVYALAYLILRYLVAWVVGIWGIGDEVLRRKLWLIPLRDAIYFAVWLSSFASNRVIWGDSQFALKRGEMTLVNSSGKSAKA